MASTKTVPANSWLACDNPHGLLRWARRVCGSRRYLLMSCAMVRERPGGVVTALGREVLAAVEAEIPTAGKPSQTDLLRAVLVPRFPDVFRADAQPYRPLTPEGSRLLGRDAPWVAAFARYVPTMRQTTTRLPNVVVEWLFRGPELHNAATAQAAAEMRELRGGKAGRPARSVYDAMRALIGLAPSEPDPGQSSWQYEWARSRALVVEYRQRLCDLIREQTGDPFRPWRPRPEWLAANDGVARRLAAEMNESGDFSLMPVLGDALEDAGCGDEEALRHCRDGGTHRRGCWVTEAVLAG